MLLSWFGKRRQIPASVPQPAADTAAQSAIQRARELMELFTEGGQRLAQRDYFGAIASYQQLLRLEPDLAPVLNNLASAQCALGQFRTAEGHLRRAIELQPELLEAHNNLGLVLRSLGRYEQAERSIRRALHSEPLFVPVHSNLGITLMYLGRMREAEAHLQEVLKVAPEHQEALLGLAQIAKLEGRLADAGTLFRRILERDPNVPGALATLAHLRRCTSADAPWLERAEKLAASGIATTEEADLRFAIGKYYDDLRDYDRAFQSYRRANELLKTTTQPFNRDGYTAFVDDLIRVYSRATIERVRDGVSSSIKPIFIVGMPRSGTTLLEQIIASHPEAAGAGELGFWTEVLFEHSAELRRGVLEESLRRRLASDYLRLLEDCGGTAARVVDKAPVNSDFLGLIYSIFPRARVIYMQRDPIDTCLSCYFQYLSPAMSWSMDLSDLAYYYQQHQRLIEHWRAVLPRETLLEVAYEELVADHEGCTRQVLAFLGLEWSERCLEFHKTARPITTASTVQVRQGIYRGSVRRWQRYERHIAPLLSLQVTRSVEG